MKQILILFFVIFAFQVWALDFPYDTHICGENENLDSIASKYISKYEREYHGDLKQFKTDLKKWNKSVHQWYPIQELTKIYIAYPYPPLISGSIYSPPLNMVEYNNNQIKKNFISLFYTFSMGNFSEKVSSSNTKIETTQNSPYSLGVSIGHIFNNINHSLLASFYWSKLISSKIADNHFSEGSNKIEIPAEIGANLYYQYLASSDFQFSTYTGLDYERFYTYNTKEIAEGTGLLNTRENSLIYATIGFTKNFYFSDYKLQVKTSIAQSVSSKSSGPLESDQFTGQRFLLFTSLRFTERLSGQLLYKYHKLDGPTQLNISRIGLGFSISLL